MKLKTCLDSLSDQDSIHYSFIDKMCERVLLFSEEQMQSLCLLQSGRAANVVLYISTIENRNESSFLSVYEKLWEGVASDSEILFCHTKLSELLDYLMDSGWPDYSLGTQACDAVSMTQAPLSLKVKPGEFVFRSYLEESFSVAWRFLWTYDASPSEVRSFMRRDRMIIRFLVDAIESGLSKESLRRCRFLCSSYPYPAALAGDC